MILLTVKTGSKGNCYLVRDKNGHYLCLDCGKDVQWRKEFLKGCRFDLEKVDSVLFTHKHRDHLGHVKDFIKSGIKMYGCDIVYGVNIIPERSFTKVDGGWWVVPWKVPHTDPDGSQVDCYAYYIKSPSGHRMAYITDFLYSPITFRNLAVETVLISCNHDDEIDKSDNAKWKHVVTGHSSVNVVKNLLLASQTDKLRHVILCHMSETNATPDAIQKEIQDAVGDKVTVTIAENGKKIII